MNPVLCHGGAGFFLGVFGWVFWESKNSVHRLADFGGRLATGLVDDCPKEFVGLAAEVSAGGDHGEDGDGDVGIEAGQGVTQGNWMFVVPE